MDTHDDFNRESDSLSSEDLTVKTIQNQHASIAKYLLKNKFLLSALEFHMELMEKGYENFELRDYFSNPGNFEGIREDATTLKPLARTSSITTFDSLDFTRMSDDGNPSDNRIQTLEYQLRAANEKIQKLQNELTFITGEKKLSSCSEGDLTAPTSCPRDLSRTQQVLPSTSGVGTLDAFSPEPILPHEKRALNYLVNEYLLQNNYKITSNTFADENEGEDLESWDEVGLHIAQPPSLCALLRDFGAQLASLPPTANSECQVEILTAARTKQLEEEAEELRMSHNSLNVDNSTLRRQVDELQGELASSRDNVVRLEKEIIERRLTFAEGPPDDASTQSESTEATIAPEGRRSPEGSSENLRRVGTGFVSELQVNIVPPNSAFGVSSQPEALLRELGVQLPRLVASVESDEARECLLPLLVYAACLHPEQRCRDQLLHALFNLSPKPNNVQRRLILQGCRSLSRYLGPGRVEAELLPQLWEQLGHVEVTRRRLVAEACSALMDFIPGLLRDSLLLSMLQQMLEDRDSDVRSAVVRALSLLTAALSDSDKLTKMQELLLSSSCLYDSQCTAVADASRRFFLPAVAQWCLEAGCLHTQLLDNLLARLEQPFVPPPASLARADNSLDHVGKHVDHLLLLVPFIGMWIKESLLGALDEAAIGPLRSCGRDAVKQEQLYLIPYLGSPLFSPSLVLCEGNSEAYGQLLARYEAATSSPTTEWSGWSCPALRWLQTELGPKLAYVLRWLPVTEARGPHPAVERLCRLLQLLGRVLGPAVTARCFEAALRRELVQNAANAKFGADAVGSNLLSGLCVGVLPVLEKYSEITATLEEAVIILSSCQRPLHSVRTAFTLLISVCGRTDIVPELLSRLASARDPLGRAAAGQLFHAALVSGQLQGNDMLANHVLPRLAELANDRESAVRAFSYRSLAQAIVLVYSGGCSADIEDQAGFLFRQMVADCEASWSEMALTEGQQHFLQKELLTAFAEAAPNLPYILRDQVMLPHLIRCVERRPCSGVNVTFRDELAHCLHNCFTAILHTSGLTPVSIRELILPTIEKLRADLAAVGSEQQHGLALTISDFQLLLGEQQSEETSGDSPTPSPAGSVRSRMMSRFRDFRDASRQPQPPQQQPQSSFASIFRKK